MSLLLTLLMMVFPVYATAANSLTASGPISHSASVEEVFSEISRHHAADLEQALRLFDSKFYSAGNFALLFRSESPQPASEVFPRIILFGKDSKLIVGFNHHLGQDRDLEIIQYREDRKKWEFREISFAGRQALMSKADPSQCLFCHGGRDAKPKLHDMEDGLTSRAFPVLAHSTLFGSDIRIRKFIKNAGADKIYSLLELPAE